MALAAYGALAAFQVWSGLQQASLIRQQGRIQESINEMNAKYAEYDAFEAEKYGYTQSARYQSVIDATVGEQRVGYASANVDVSSGTAAEVQEETRFTGFLNTLEIQNQARNRAYGLKVQASNIRLGGQMQSIQTDINAQGATLTGYAQGFGSAVEAYNRAPAKSPNKIDGYSGSKRIE